MNLAHRLFSFRLDTPRGALVALTAITAPLAMPALMEAAAPAYADAPPQFTGASTPAYQMVAEEPQSYSQAMVDNANVLTPEELAEINDAIEHYQIDHQRSLMIVYQDSFDGTDPREFAQHTLQANGGYNLVVLVVATEDRQYYVQGGEDWSEAEAKELDEAVRPHLTQQQWADAARAFVETAQSSGQISGQSVAWLGGATVAAVGAGGGLWWWSRRRRKENEAQQLERAEQIDPHDRDSLMEVPLATLRQLAREAVVATDESVRRGEEEVKLALAEFGEERARPFTAALQEARQAMDGAYAAQRRLELKTTTSTALQKELIVDTISACSAAQEALDTQADRFAENRALLMNTEAHLGELTRMTVDVRARLPQAEAKLAGLRDQHAPEALTPIAHNVELAEASVVEAEDKIDHARAAAARPAGQQAEAVEAIRDAEHAVKVADRMLDAIDHADDDIAAARANLPDLITEIEQEAADAQDLAQRGHKTGALDGRALLALAKEANSAATQAKTTSEKDPLSSYQHLLDLDARLDAALAQAGQATANRERLIHIYQQQLSTARAAVQAADDLIASRGRTVGPAARNALAAATQELRQAEDGTGDLRHRSEHAAQATEHAKRAGNLARRDFENYQRRNQRGSGGGAFLAGMLVNGILSGGGRGGFGAGGFSAGGFGGGSGGRF